MASVWILAIFIFYIEKCVANRHFKLYLCMRCWNKTCPNVYMKI